MNLTRGRCYNPPAKLLVINYGVAVSRLTLLAIRHSISGPPPPSIHAIRHPLSAIQVLLLVLVLALVLVLGAQMTSSSHRRALPLHDGAF